MGPSPTISPRGDQNLVRANDMANRRRRRNRGRGRESSSKKVPGIGVPLATARPPEKESSGTNVTNTGSKAQKPDVVEKPKYEWMAIEHRDADGNLTLPKKMIKGTFLRRYGEVPEGTPIRIHVLAGYKPKALMLVERKIYEVHRIFVHGWRRSGQIVVEVEGWRQHEADWFTAMQGVDLEISDPGLPSVYHEKSEYVVSQSSFGRKIVTLVGEKGSETEVQLYEGKLDLTETWKSAFRRQTAEMLNMGFKLLLLPLLSALLAGLAVWWISRLPSPDVYDSKVLGNSGEQRVQPGMGESATQLSDSPADGQSPNVPVRQADPDKQNSNTKTSEGDAGNQTLEGDGRE